MTQKGFEKEIRYQAMLSICRAMLRKVTKTRSVFPTDDSLFKMLYLAMVDITKKWTGRQRDWSMIHAQLSIYFAERMPE